MEYQPLKKEDDEIRLLTIANDESGIVKCTIEHVSLRASPSYKALSYCWGDAKDTTPVIINGCDMEVTVNLEAALRQLRYEDHAWIWIDALCINQSDLIERGELVLRMGDIYSKAVEVIAWLGLEADNSNRAMDFMKSFGAFATSRFRQGMKLNFHMFISGEECKANDTTS